MGSLNDPDDTQPIYCGHPKFEDQAFYNGLITEVAPELVQKCSDTVSSILLT